jgi:beta-glucosidase
MDLYKLAFSVLALAGVQAANPQQLRSRDALAFSEPHYPSPWMDAQANGWEDAYAKAKAFVEQLTLAEKVNLTTGVGYVFPHRHRHIGSRLV